MKKIITFIVALASLGNVFAQTSENPTDDSLPHNVILDIEYQISNFEYAKNSGKYGFGINRTSFDGKSSKKFHAGANFHMDWNAGLVSDFSIMFELGPSFRYDISNNCLINVPLNVLLNLLPYREDGKSKTDVSWGLRLGPSLYYFFSKSVGIFAGPQLMLPFAKKQRSHLVYRQESPFLFGRILRPTA